MLATVPNGPSSASTSAFLRSSSSRPGVLKTLRRDTLVPAEALEMRELEVWRPRSWGE